MVAVLGMLLAGTHAGSPEARAETDDRDVTGKGAKHNERPRTDKEPRQDMELRVGLLIGQDLLHPAKDDTRDRPPSHRLFLIREVQRWPKEFPARAGQRTMKVEVVEVGKEPPKVGDYDLLVLMPCWAYSSEATATLDRHAKVFHEYIKQGGGLLVFQPNPMDNYPEAIDKDFAAQGLKKLGLSAPKLLPQPATFYNWYNVEEARRTDAKHPITEGLQDSQMPFPADQIVDLAKDYAVLARGTKSGSPSLAAGTFGEGRVVLIVCNVNGDQVSRQERRSDVVARAILWAGGCGDKEVMAVGGR